MTVLDSPSEQLSFGTPDLSDPQAIEQTRYEILDVSDRLRQGETKLSPEARNYMATLAARILTEPPLPAFERFHTASQLLANLPDADQPPELRKTLESVIDEAAPEAFPHNTAEEVVATLYAIRRTDRERSYPLALEEAHTKLGQSTDDVINKSQAVIRQQRETARRQAALLDETNESDYTDFSL